MTAAYTEFYCNPSTGSNLNSGSTTSGTPAYTSTNGNWVSTTGVFIPLSGNPSLSVNVGDFASVYNDGASATPFVGRVTAVDATTITVSTTIKAGTAPTTSATARSIVVGGCFKGPNGADRFPLDTNFSLCVNTSSKPIRINLKNNASYAISAVIIVNAVSGGGIVQGYTTTPGDLGRATIDGGAAAIALATTSGTSLGYLADIIFQNTTLTTSVAVGITSGTVLRCRVTNVGSGGFGGTGGRLVECEADHCNTTSLAGSGGFMLSGSCLASRCFSHDNTLAGFASISGTTPANVHDCTATRNTGHGFHILSGIGGLSLQKCNSYNNTLSGLSAEGTPSTTAMPLFIENCNFIKNGAWDIDLSSGTVKNGYIKNCGFGSGTMASTSGSINPHATPNVDISGSVTYAANVTPWVDPTNDDFTINLAAAANAGYAAFPGTAAATVSAPDIGVGQHSEPTAAAIASAVWGRSERTLTA